MSFVLFGALSRTAPPSDACAPAANVSAAMNARMIFFILVCSGSMRCEGHALRHGLEFAETTPPRHQQEEAEIEQGTHLRHALANRRRRLRAEVGQHHEVDHED